MTSHDLCIVCTLTSPTTSLELLADLSFFRFSQSIASIKHHKMATSIYSRKRDLAYLTYFIISVPNMLLMDFQALYPTHLVPGFMKALSSFYINTYNDRFFITHPPFFQAFIFSEIIFQLPVSIWAIRALPRDSPKVPLVLLPFATLVFGTTATCIYEFSQWDVPLQNKIDLSTLYGPYLALSECH
ncbi:hypothetical protein BJ878DRAFT_502922 [Calycina marina]|uniref:EXPERA domain-containing protein n=1 Tax=Calycina marina TaxID=1763456 RepID=A0A9P8CFG4_9HELO|nr:hypothetical protein BJ878DRAFT_502922 [Calycina marina]